jgi:rhodanese-related sulfurtransferase
MILPRFTPIIKHVHSTSHDHYNPYLRFSSEVFTGSISVNFMCGLMVDTVTDLVKALPDNSSVNTAQHATIEEAVFSVDLTDVPIDWLDSDHVICVYCRSMHDNSFRAVTSYK